MELFANEKDTRVRKKSGPDGLGLQDLAEFREGPGFRASVLEARTHPCFQSRFGKQGCFPTRTQGRVRYLVGEINFAQVGDGVGTTLPAGFTRAFSGARRMRRLSDSWFTTAKCFPGVSIPKWRGIVP